MDLKTWRCETRLLCYVVAEHLSYYVENRPGIYGSDLYFLSRCMMKGLVLCIHIVLKI